jgi:hypothetical protein
MRPSVNLPNLRAQLLAIMKYCEEIARKKEKP